MEVVSKQAITGDNTSVTLARGNACLPCRKRKMKCDGAHPVCYQCTRKGRPDDCEYTNGQGLTRSQMLEENIALLETRIRELENADATAPSVKLHTVAQRSTSSPEDGSEGAVADLNPEIGNDEDALLLQAVVTPETPAIGEEYSDLIDAFLPHATQLGFFLHVPTFIRSVHTYARDQRSFGTLLAAIYLWGNLLSSDQGDDGERLLTNTTERLTESLFLSSGTGQQDHSILYIIQTEVLLANYYFFHGRQLEGRYHTGAAVSMVLSCKLNLIRSDFQGAEYQTPLALTSPTNDIQEGERVNAFWTVYILDNVWSVASGGPPAIPAEISLPLAREVSIDTPWPVDIDVLARLLNLPERTHGTVQRFISGVDAGITEVGGEAGLALYAKAAALFARANWLNSQFQEGPGLDYSFENVASLDGLITTFINALPPSTDAGTVGLMVTHTLARVALIRLHLSLKRQDQASKDSCVAAADSALAILDRLNIQATGTRVVIDPILPVGSTPLLNVTVLMTLMCDLLL
ncbi:hypothetical protein BXZ70DRAFT_719990 [Cristinia sonorae]|uniref:Zn(2)-C6 fungal-type domain-containing protein n=1 Tax=Cristinia sonorae TaxID=1940300 RepID=A0A8K0UV40_9AGAR|nr:hypothetical protein BXZ70DRAFT_719990 [Cristinia sonorae]